MRIFLDTNVLLDFVQDGRPNNNAAKYLFQILRSSGQEPFITTQSILDMYFIASKTDRVKALRFIDYLLSIFNVRPIESYCLRSALESGNHDFEDSAQLACAEDEECDVFLTSDEGILRRDITSMLVMTPGQFLDRLR